jgi:ribosomal protein S18 acetylase RimI-like enzyme
MQVRPAKVEDVPGVLPLVARICAFHEQRDPAKYSFIPHPELRYEKWLESRATDARSVFLVAEHDAAIVAFLVATIEPEISVFSLKEFGFIHDVWVEEAYRNEGLARQIVTLAIEAFTALGQKQIRCDVLNMNDPARKLFEACGFRPSVTEMLLEIA